MPYRTHALGQGELKNAVSKYEYCNGIQSETIRMRMCTMLIDDMVLLPYTLPFKLRAADFLIAKKADVNAVDRVSD